MNEQGACPLLEPDRRCGVQAAAGEPALPTACSIFPRTALAVAGRLEIGASLACPEVSRLVLLGQQPLELRQTDREMLPRPYVGAAVNGDPDDAYSHFFLEIREFMLRLIRRPDVPLASRLVAAAHFAERVGPFFHAGTTEFVGAKLRFAERRLRLEMAEVETRGFLETLDRDLSGINVPGADTAAMLATLLIERKQLHHSPRYADLLRAVFSSLQQEALGRPASAEDSVTPDQLFAVYARRRQALQSRIGSRLELLFANYCQHFVLRNPFTQVASLLEYLYRMLVQVAALHLLTVGHPRLVARPMAPPETNPDEAALNEVVVHVTQTFTKAIDHQRQFLDVALSAGGEAGGFSFGRLLVLAKFL